MKVLTSTSILLLGSMLSSFATEIIGSIYSESLERDVRYIVKVPPTYFVFNKDKIYPVLYGLHGSGGDAGAMTSLTSQHSAIALNYPVIVVGFDANGYSNYETFFFEELVPFIESEYRAGRSSDMRAVYGFSAGGGGAFHYMLERPDFFSSVIAVAGALGGSDFARIASYAEDGIELPPIHLYCGSEDSLLNSTVEMTEVLSETDYYFESDIIEGGIHHWSFVESISVDMLEWQYQYFTFPDEGTVWRNTYSITDNIYVDTGNFIGYLNVEHDPWVWSYNLSNWLYVPEGSIESGAWVWISSF